MLIKPGVSIDRLCRSCRRTLNKLNANFPDFVITSTYEGTHSASSLHYANQAFDIRLCYPVKWKEIDPNLLEQILGTGFDLLRETTHFHVEYDP